MLLKWKVSIYSSMMTKYTKTRSCPSSWSAHRNESNHRPTKSTKSQTQVLTCFSKNGTATFATSSTIWPNKFTHSWLPVMPGTSSRYVMSVTPHWVRCLILCRAFVRHPSYLPKSRYKPNVMDNRDKDYTLVDFAISCTAILIAFAISCFINSL